MASELLSDLDDSIVDCHPLTNNPTTAWELLKLSQTVYEVEPHPIDLPVTDDAVRFVCMSDTHSSLKDFKGIIPPGDIFLHAGDFSRCGGVQEIKDFNNFIGCLPHQYKVVIAGNHELSFDPLTASTEYLQKSHIFTSNLYDKDVTDVRQYLTKCMYLEDSSVEIYGISIYGSPWQPRYGNWAFNLTRGEQCLEKWRKIPTGIDVLLTHTPPLGHGDLTVIGQHVGCVELLLSVQQRIKPKYHVFGHIHEGYGITSNGQTKFVNCSMCNVYYQPVNSPIIFDIPLPKGQKKLF